MDYSEAKLQEKSQLYFWLCQLARQLDAGVLILDPANNNEVTFSNQVFTIMTGYSEDELLGQQISILNGPMTNADSFCILQESLTSAITHKLAMFSYRKNNSAFWNEIGISPVRDQQGTLLYYYVICRDVTNQINIENVITLEREVYIAIEEGIHIESILEKICNDIALTFQKKCNCTILLLEGEHLRIAAQGEIPAEFQLHIDQKEFQKLLTQPNNVQKILEPRVITSLQSENFKGFQDVVQYGNVSCYWSHPLIGQDGEVIGIFSLVFNESIEPSFNDYQFLDRIGPIVSLALKYFEQKSEINQLAFSDSSTGLANLPLFMLTLEREQMNGIVFIVQPGDFQKIIDSYGRDGGNDILRQLAERLAKLKMFKSAKIARHTSSSIILAMPPFAYDCKTIHRKLNAAMQEPMFVEEKQIYIHVKVGIAEIEDPANPLLAIQQADVALSAVANSIGTSIYCYEPSLVETIQEEMTVLMNISKAVKNKEFYPVLQPKVNIETGDIESFEALARWHSEELGFVTPNVFIPVAESSGNIHKIDRSILLKVLEWLKERQAAGKKLYQVAVNISPAHFYYPAFVDNVRRYISEYDIDPRYIKFEITESVELGNVLRAQKIINDLQEHGIATSIDDFGVGYSSLSYLQQLPFKEIKIDKSFIDDLREPRKKAIVKTLIQLATDLQMTAVAEGIETEEQYEELKLLGCHIGQGYYFYKPMLLEDIDSLLEESNSAYSEV